MRAGFLTLFVTLLFIGPRFGSEALAESPLTQEAGDTPAPIAADPAKVDALTKPQAATKTAPEWFTARFTLSTGNSFTVKAYRKWAPNGADRFYNLVSLGFYDGVTFFRAINNFMVQFGIHGDPVVSKEWTAARIDDDPVLQSNTRGKVTFATAGPNTRTAQVFINYTDRNAQLDNMGFAPFGEIIDGMDSVDGIHQGYGEGAPRGKGPDQGRIQAEGNSYLNAEFPLLDHIVSATILEEAPPVALAAKTSEEPAQDAGGCGCQIAPVSQGLALFTLLPIAFMRRRR